MRGGDVSGMKNKAKPYGTNSCMNILINGQDVCKHMILHPIYMFNIICNALHILFTLFILLMYLYFNVFIFCNLFIFELIYLLTYLFLNVIILTLIHFKCIYVCVHACVHVRVCTCMFVRACVCMHSCTIQE